jgi:hypothetical protein
MAVSLTCALTRQVCEGVTRPEAAFLQRNNSDPPARPNVSKDEGRASAPLLESKLNLKVAWSTPTLTEMPWTGEIAALYEAEAERCLDEPCQGATQNDCD